MLRSASPLTAQRLFGFVAPCTRHDGSRLSTLVSLIGDLIVGGARNVCALLSEVMLGCLGKCQSDAVGGVDQAVAVEAESDPIA